MNEQEQISQLSALFDGELPPEQAGMVIRRALRDPGTRATWGRYALIGACVRGDPIGTGLPQTDVAARVRARLAAEAEHSSAAALAGDAAASNAARRRSLLGRGALGGAIAASVAAVSLVMIRMLGPTEIPTGAQLAAAPAPRNETVVAAVAPAQRAPVQTVLREASLPSYTTPVDDSPSRRNAPLVSYVVAHNQVAASAVGFAPLSSVMSGSYDLTQDAVEMTPAEVGARR
jgi:negative regulator of sigma E activity